MDLHMNTPETATEPSVFGLIGRMVALPGRRAELIEALSAGSVDLPGCVSYVIAEDVADPDALWITEAWESEQAHRASLDLPQVQQAIAIGRPLIASMDGHPTRPVSGL